MIFDEIKFSPASVYLIPYLQLIAEKKQDNNGSVSAAFTITKLKIGLGFYPLCEPLAKATFENPKYL